MRPQNYVEMHETFLSEELFFGLLGKILYQDPDRAWYKSLLEGEVVSEVPRRRSAGYDKRFENNPGLDQEESWIDREIL